MAGWLHGVFVGDWLFVFPLCGFSLSLFCNYQHALAQTPCNVGCQLLPAGNVCSLPSLFSHMFGTMHACVPLQRQ